MKKIPDRIEDVPPPSSSVLGRGTLLPDPEELWGIAGSPGLAVGNIAVISAESSRFARRRIRSSEIRRDTGRLDSAIARASGELQVLRNRSGSSDNAAELSILDAYILMINDPMLHDEVRRQMTIERKCVEWALATAVQEMAQRLAGLGDAYLRQRARDIEFVGESLQKALRGNSSVGPFVPGDLATPKILVARDLSPADTASLTPDNVLALVTELGTRMSHTAIIARALEIPAVVGCPDLLERITGHDHIIVDGNQGWVALSPAAEAIEEARDRSQIHRAWMEQLQESRSAPAQSACGTPLQLHANIELPFEAGIALNEGATGIGLYRTEFQLVGRKSPPSEEIQYKAYREVLEAVGSYPVTLRTFDIGGDKFPGLLPVEEENPALGLRAVRLALRQPEVFKAQLRAMIRAAAHGELRIMVPLISTVGEFRQVRELKRQAEEEVSRELGQQTAPVPLGCMIEVPSAALMADHFAQRADFLSVGTNDLAQYTMAADRGRRELAHLTSTFEPALLRLLKAVVDAAERHQCEVSVCGAMASHPLAAVLLMGLGFRRLSLEAAAIGTAKAALSRVRVGEAAEAAELALQAVTAPDVDQILVERFQDPLSDLLNYSKRPNG